MSVPTPVTYVEKSGYFDHRLSKFTRRGKVRAAEIRRIIAENGLQVISPLDHYKPFKIDCPELERDLLRYFSKRAI